MLRAISAVAAPVLLDRGRDCRCDLRHLVDDLADTLDGVDASWSIPDGGDLRGDASWRARLRREAS